ncbi:hypothetical protein EW026_g2824 [Hermanssonia centrifuga]|uniref:Mediator of RNA polymerase II transcription subunit 13 n=1 Tax=Hermanssonia centrifuga TaxID=98765 RepID=A0A4V6S0Z9_9APHY|nr:hypothetical protein EW026_g2824 [Hermanssonia centrifuga]
MFDSANTMYNMSSSFFPFGYVLCTILFSITSCTMDFFRMPSPSQTLTWPLFTIYTGAVRLKGGFLLSSPASSFASEWGTGWDHYTLQRTLVHCELQIQLCSSRLLVHPILRPTHYLPLSNILPAPAGTPITLLPLGVPAYYLNIYSGPVGGLTSQFESALSGLGAGDWKNPCSRDHFSHAAPSAIKDGMPSYAIVWLSVQNSQGEAKGIPLIWPARLCIALSTTAPHIRPPLEYIPSLPTQLQASPPALTAQDHPVKLIRRSLTPATVLSGAPSPISEQTAPTTSQRATSMPVSSEGGLLVPKAVRPVLSPRSPTSDSLRAFRALTLTNTDVGVIAQEVSGFVDAIMKERERERERLRREREGSSSKLGTNAIKPEKMEEPSQPSPLPSTQMHVDESVPSKMEDTVNAVHDYAFPTPEQRTSPADPYRAGSTPLDVLLPAAGITSASDVRQPSTVEPTKKEEAADGNDLPSESAVISTSDPISYDTFPVFETNWGQPAGEFLTMDMGIDNFGVGFSVGMTGLGEMETNFGGFTDDDFNFFDAPAPNTRSFTVTGSGLTPAAGPAPFGIPPPAFSTGIIPLGLGPPSGLSQAHPLPWMTQVLGEAFTPHSIDTPVSAMLPPPELLPATPALTPPSQSAPVTPVVVLSDRESITYRRKGSIGNLSPSAFDPIPFARSHKMADGKYLMGKFALPSPPDEEDRMIRRLVGAKRKRGGYDDAGRGEKLSPSWMDGPDGWISSSPGNMLDTDMADPRSESESGSESGELDGLFAEERDAKSVSRPHTPPPAYLPLGPTLVQTQFCHQFLLPLSIPLRPPGVGIQNPAAAAPMSVPTPVSPAAVLGAMSEKSKALEDAAQILVKEVVENCIWAKVWRANAVAAQGATNPPSKLWQVDVKGVHKLLSLSGIPSSLSLEEVFSDEVVDTVSLQLLGRPLLSVGKSDSIIQVLPSALRFWEKLGLSPRSGSKDVVAFVLTDKYDEEKGRCITTWLDRMSVVYAAKNFGKHSVGHAPECVVDGVVSVNFDAFRKMLPLFVENVTKSTDRNHCTIVLYVVLPAHIINLASPVLRHVLSAIKRANRKFKNSDILFQFVPEPFVVGSLDDPSANNSGLEPLVDSLYDRIRLPARRTMSRKILPADEKKTRALFQEPAYTLARSLHSKVKFVREAHVSTLDVMDRHTLLQVGYYISPCRKWLFAACTDQRAEAHNVRAWLMPTDSREPFVVAHIWDFAQSMAMKASIEWHIVITRVGSMSATEFDAWMSQLNSEMFANIDLPPVQVSILVAQPDDPWMFLAPEHVPVIKSPTSTSRTPKIATGSVVQDISASFYILDTTLRQTIPPTSQEYVSERTCIPDAEEEEPTEEFGLRSRSSITLIRVPAGTDYTPISMLHLHLLHSGRSTHSSVIEAEVAILYDVTRNFSDLLTVTQHRWKLKANPLLPFHLAALEVMHATLDTGDVLVD